MLLCAPSAHSSPLGFAPANAQKQDPNPSPRVMGARRDIQSDSDEGHIGATTATNDTAGKNAMPDLAVAGIRTFRWKSEGGILAQERSVWPAQPRGGPV